MNSNLFAALGVSDELAEALNKHGYTEPTPIQQQAIPVVIAGEDVIAQAQTGTGKTLAFVLPILERIDARKNYTQALIVTPTRELAIQIAGEVQKWAPIKGIRVLAAYGGQDVERQLKKLEGTVHMIIATPGRLLDHLRRETVQLQRLSTLVLDEADQMLHMGFLNEVEEIIIQTSPKRQTLLFSATMPGPIRNLAKSYMRNPQEIKVKSKQVTLTEIEQIAVKTTDRGKQDALCRLIDEYRPYLAMIFCRTKLRASKLNEALQDRGYASDELHGDLTQAKREQVMKKFREAKIQLLVATDIAARGLDVEGITHVFNYDIPHDVESYIHRIGRTGRAGQRGMAVTMVAQRDQGTLEAIERGIHAELPRRTFRADGELSVARTSGRSSARDDERSHDREEQGQRQARRGEQRGRRGAGRADVKQVRGRGTANATRDGGDWTQGRAERDGVKQDRGRGTASATRDGGEWTQGRAERDGVKQMRGRGAAGAARDGGEWTQERAGRVGAKQDRGRGAAGAARDGGDWTQERAGRDGAKQVRGRGAAGAAREGGDWTQERAGRDGAKQVRGRGAAGAARETGDWTPGRAGRDAAKPARGRGAAGAAREGGDWTPGRAGRDAAKPARGRSADGASRSGGGRGGQSQPGNRSGRTDNRAKGNGRNDTGGRGRRGR
ncbi:DEAD/DEAH box helicase [Paenibacillus sp. NPDC056579]|uniref:DEAD/DEAH box helicase n=1 Tax=Paenibacillus sp. NPDC056579 TaxID=3345871 RepID=UPI00368CC2DE